jgi:hypothetical protein
MSEANHISTTALAKKYSLTSKELFNQLEALALILREEGKWVLTKEGVSTGGLYKQSKQYGRYIVWPQDLHIEEEGATNTLITATTIGQKFNLSAIKINFMLSELGWIKKEMKGWTVTEQGKKQGGVQSESQKTGVPFSRWPDIILSSKILNDSVEHMLGNKPINSQNDDDDMLGFRDKFPAKHRTADGHLVRSKAEMLIDNWLYMAGIVHAYERKLPIEETLYCDFYIPTGKVYIEYWGYEDDSKYIARKKIKQEIYKKYNLNLIELNDSDVLLLDDVLPKYLLKYGVSAY